MFLEARDFFRSPLENKATCAVNSKESGKNSGWFGMNTETLDPANQRTGDFKECFNINDFVNGKPQQPLPDPLLSRQNEIDAFVHQCHSLCLKLLRLFAIGLEIDESSGGEDWFSPTHDKSKGSSGSVLRMLYYPKIDLGPSFQSGSDIRAGAHSDYGTVTLLFQRQGQPGLEILTEGHHHSDPASWQPVPVNPTNDESLPILVNVGDLLSYWSNGLLRSTVHRVAFPRNGSGDDRYSIAYFCHPLDDARLEPVPSKIVQDCTHEQGPSRVGRGNAMSAKEHLESRLRATYS
jgi:isopenicillin N synthase-like dioxygenase